MHIKHYTDPQATALALAEEVFVQGSQQGHPIHIAISGGSTPRLLFELLVTPEISARIRWEHIRLYWVDERCVPPTDEQSNYGMTQATLLSHVPLNGAFVYRIHGENAPECEAERYTSLVCSSLSASSEGLPVFDYILLGIGDDGHTSSIFPHQMELLHETTPYAVATHPSGQRRIALTGPTILAARYVIFHAVGQSKCRILQQIRDSATEAEVYPAAYFFKARADIQLYTDQSL